MITYDKIIDILNSIYAVDGNYQPDEIMSAIEIAIKCVSIIKLQQKESFPPKSKNTKKYFIN